MRDERILPWSNKTFRNANRSIDRNGWGIYFFAIHKHVWTPHFIIRHMDGSTEMQGKFQPIWNEYDSTFLWIIFSPVLFPSNISRRFTASRLSASDKFPSTASTFFPQNWILIGLKFWIVNGVQGYGVTIVDNVATPCTWYAFCWIRFNYFLLSK